MAFINTEDGNVLITHDDDYLITEGLGSVRYQIVQAVIDALEEITIANGYNTDVEYVSSNLNIEHPDQLDKNQFPCCFPYDDDEEKEVMTLYYDTDDDILSKLTIIVTSMVYDKSGETLLKRTNLMKDVEKTMLNNTTLNALLLEEPDPMEITTDKGFFTNYSVFDQKFLLKYTYSHTTGG